MEVPAERFLGVVVNLTRTSSVEQWKVIFYGKFVKGVMSKGLLVPEDVEESAE